MSFTEFEAPTAPEFEQFPDHWLESGQTPVELPYVDYSLESPDTQFAALAMIQEADDAKHPAPFTGTPPWPQYGEGDDPRDLLPEGDIEAAYMPAPDLDPSANVELLSVISDAFPHDIPRWTWENDPQYFGLGVPPGVENLDQPVESGHTQITPNNPSAEHGWDAWSGRPQLARVARHENYFSGYGRGVMRRQGERAVEKFTMPYSLMTQQYRDLLLAELNRRGVHEAVIADVPSVPYTEQVTVVDPGVLTEGVPINSETGVLPW